LLAQRKGNGHAHANTVDLAKNEAALLVTTNGAGRSLLVGANSRTPTPGQRRTARAG
jgi:hypothetical protein